jgi:hypothetical protein
LWRILWSRLMSQRTCDLQMMTGDFILNCECQIFYEKVSLKNLFCNVIIHYKLERMIL